MENYIHDIPTKVYFGKGQISHLCESLERYGKNVLLCYGGGSIKRIGLYDEIISLLQEGGFKVTELSGIEPNPRIESVEKGVRLCHENCIDVVLAAGGGSTIDCAKAVCSGAFFTGEDLWDLVKHNREVKPDRALPLVVVLTLSATGSEFDGGGVITNLSTHEKMGASFTYPSVSICDPTYTYSVSKYQTAAGAADIMSHVMEEYFSRTDDSDLSEGIAESILTSVIRNLPIALEEPDNYSARANLMIDSTIACSGIPGYGKKYTGWPCHAMEHELSAYYDITHGVGLAILTPRWMRYILKKDPSVMGRFVRFSRNVWHLYDDNEEVLAYKGIEALESFFKEVGIPMTLTQLGIGEEHFKDMAVHATSSGRLKNAYVPLDEEDIVQIFKNCM